MTIKKLLITVDDSLSDEDTDALTSAVSNLKYDGYTIIKAKEKKKLWQS